MAYQFFSQIDILASAVGEDEQNIPIALVLTDARFKTTGNGGHVENTDASGGASGSLTVPADLVVGPNEDGSSEYDFEFVDYNATTGYMEFWVEIVALSSSVDTPVIFAYGDSGVTTSQEDVAGVWSNDYEGVWHLGEASGTILDSTSNDLDSTTIGGDPTYGATGQIGDAIDWDGDDYALVANTLGSVAAVTLEIWVNADTEGEEKYFVRRTGSGTASGFLIGQTVADAKYACAAHVGGEQSIVSTTGIDTSSLKYVAMTYDASVLRIFVSGAEENTATLDTALSNTASEEIRIACLATTVQRTDGILDEIRFSSTDRSANWLATCYNNQSSPAPDDTFWSALGSEKTPGQPMRHRLGRTTIMASPMRVMY